MKRLWCLVLCLALLTACGGQAEQKTTTIFAMDTVMDLTAYGPGADQALAAAAKEINRLDALLSVSRPGSDIAKINRSGDCEAADVSEETLELVRRSLALCGETGGALDITVYPAMEAWGFPEGEYRLPDAEVLDRLQTIVDYQGVVAEDAGILCAAGQKIDLGAVGKGYAGDCVMALWQDMGLASGIVSLGGNVQCLGAKPDGSDWVVAVRDPEDEGRYLATVSGRDMAVVTSGGYQRYFEQDGVTYHHILDPKTCAPARSGAASVTIVADSGFLADGLSTALFVMGLDAAADYWRAHRNFDMLYYTDSSQLWYTPGLEGRLELWPGIQCGVLE